MKWWVMMMILKISKRNGRWCSKTKLKMPSKWWLKMLKYGERGSGLQWWDKFLSAMKLMSCKWGIYKEMREQRWWGKNNEYYKATRCCGVGLGRKWVDAETERTVKISNNQNRNQVVNSLRRAKNIKSWSETWRMLRRGSMRGVIPTNYARFSVQFGFHWKNSFNRV